MSLLSGLISPGLTALTQGVGAYQGAQAKASDKRTEDALRQVMALRQQHEQEIKDQLMKAQIGHYNAQSNAITNPTPKKVYDSARGVMVDEGAGSATPVAGLPDKPEKPVAQGHVVDPVTGEVKFFDPTKPPQDMRVHPAPRPDTFTPVQVGGGDDGPPIIKPFNTHTGTVGDPIGTGKQTLRIESATNTAAKARLEAGISELNNAHNGMSEYEQKLANGTANINGLQQFAARAANTFTHDDPVSVAVQSSALAALNKTNPDLARYIRRGLSFAEGESMISQRPSDFRTRMAAFLSTAASGASPQMIADIESRRSAILKPLNALGQKAAPAAGAAPSAPNPLRAKYDAAVAHLKATGRASEIPNLPGPPDEEE